MLPLCGQTTVFGGNRPAIGFRQFRVVGSGIEHRFNGEGHPFLHCDTCIGLTVVQYLRVFVKHAADAVSAIIPHHRIVVCFG